MWRQWEVATPRGVGGREGGTWTRAEGNGRHATGGGPMVFTTADGGASWSPVAHDLPTTVSLFAVSVATASVAVAWGPGPVGGDAIYRSLNGGVNWEVDLFTSPRDIRDIVMFSETTGVAVGLGAIFRRQ